MTDANLKKKTGIFESIIWNFLKIPVKQIHNIKDDKFSVLWCFPED
jgi:hypothetical protein